MFKYSNLKLEFRINSMYWKRRPLNHIKYFFDLDRKSNRYVEIKSWVKRFLSFFVDREINRNNEMTRYISSTLSPHTLDKNSCRNISDSSIYVFLWQWNVNPNTKYPLPTRVSAYFSINRLHRVSTNYSTLVSSRLFPHIPNTKGRKYNIYNKQRKVFWKWHQFTARIDVLPYDLK